MARTLMPPLGRLRPRKYINGVLRLMIQNIYDEMLHAQGDADKSGSLEDQAYYEGIVEGFKMVLKMFTHTKFEEK